MKHKFHDKCSNNQAEKMTIVKALQAIDNKNKQHHPKNNKDTYRQQDTLESLKNTKNRTHLIEEIRKTIALEKEDWDIEYASIKAHAGKYGNELW